MKIKSGLIKVAGVVGLFALLIMSSLSSSTQRADALQATQAATAPVAAGPGSLAPNMENALVPCGSGVTGPCDLVATQAEDIVGVWKQFFLGPFFNAPGEMGYIRFNSNGTFNAADTIEHTTKPFKNYPTGTFKFKGQRFTTPTVLNDNVKSAPCSLETDVYQARVLKYGDKPVALTFVVINDECLGRVGDYIQPLIWVAPNTQ